MVHLDSDPSGAMLVSLSTVEPLFQTLFPSVNDSHMDLRMSCAALPPTVVLALALRLALCLAGLLAGKPADNTKHQA